LEQERVKEATCGGSYGHRYVNRITEGIKHELADRLSGYASFSTFPHAFSQHHRFALIHWKHFPFQSNRHLPVLAHHSRSTITLRHSFASLSSPYRSHVSIRPSSCSPGLDASSL